MSRPDEETRAALWRLQRERRAAFRRRLAALLAGSPTAAARVRDAWQPLIDYDTDRRIDQ